MLTYIKKIWLKKVARSNYIAYLNIADSYDCGLSLAHYMNPRLSMHRDKFNEALDKLALIDSSASKQRLK